MKAELTEKKMSYDDLDIYNIAVDLAVEVHKMTLQKLPKFEMYARREIR